MSFFDGVDMDAQRKADQEASDSPKFDPKPGDMVDAVLTKAEYVPPKQYAASIVINFRNVGDETVGDVEAGKVGYLFLPTVLRRKMLEAAPAIGTAFRLRYEGKVTPESGGNPYKDWTLVTESMEDNSKMDRHLWDSINPDMRVGQAATQQAGNVQRDGGDDAGWRF